MAVGLRRSAQQGQIKAPANVRRVDLVRQDDHARAHRHPCASGIPARHDLRPRELHRRYDHQRSQSSALFRRVGRAVAGHRIRRRDVSSARRSAGREDRADRDAARRRPRHRIAECRSGRRHLRRHGVRSHDRSRVTQGRAGAGRPQGRYRQDLGRRSQWPSAEARRPALSRHHRRRPQARPEGERARLLSRRRGRSRRRRHRRLRAPRARQGDGRCARGGDREARGLCDGQPVEPAQIDLRGGAGVALASRSDGTAADASR